MSSRTRKRQHAGGGGPIVELPGWRIMMIEAAQIVGAENPVEIARCESCILAPQRRRLPSARSGVNRVDLDAAADGSSCLRRTRVRSHRSASASLENQIVMSSFDQPEVAPQKTFFRICGRGVEPVPRIGLEAIVAYPGWRAARRPPVGFTMSAAAWAIRLARRHRGLDQQKSAPQGRRRPRSPDHRPTRVRRSARRQQRPRRPVGV